MTEWGVNTKERVCEKVWRVSMLPADGTRPSVVKGHDGIVRSSTFVKLREDADSGLFRMKRLLQNKPSTTHMYEWETRSEETEETQEPGCRNFYSEMNGYL